MIIKCPFCGKEFAVNSLGRKPLGKPVIIVYDALQMCSSIAAASRKLQCSRGFIYKMFEKYGVTPKDVMKGKWKPPQEMEEGRGVS